MQIAGSTDDAFLGLLREGDLAGDGMLGPTMEAILTDQFHRSFFGRGGLFWEDDDASLAAVAGFESEILSSSLAAVINDNTGAVVEGDGFFLRDSGAGMGRYGAAGPFQEWVVL